MTLHEFVLFERIWLASFFHIPFARNKLSNKLYAQEEIARFGPSSSLMPAQVREFARSKVTLIGGIDSDILRQDTRAIQKAVAAVQPFVEEGHFIPLADGRVREDVPYPNYAFYRQELNRVFVMNRS